MVGGRVGIALYKIFIKPKMNQIGAKVGNNEVLKTWSKAFKFRVWNLDLKVKDMKADGADKNFGPVYIMIPTINQIHHLV